ncbi:XrtA/PEP-CTERM system TPR-repeat protein PrsT [Aquabacterium sp.]|uniref:XrtA/PEP-CTERM system TPR-repeat protein PrsT n=1 Tax=Aquabacterium sp. TaxID=1872578 RepID=UPI003784A563
MRMTARVLGVAGLVLLLATACRDDADALPAAQQALSRHDANAALVHLKLALQQHPDTALARFLMGRLLLERGDAAGAAIELGKAKDLGHPAEQVLPLLARALLRQGEHVQVLQVVAEGEALPPAARADLQTSAAIVRFRQGNQVAGEAALDGALRLSPGLVAARVLRAERLAAGGDRAAALAFSHETVRGSPADAAAWLAHAQLLSATGEAGATEALAAFRQVVELKGDIPAARAGILRILVERQAFQEAETELAALRQQYPQHAATVYFDAVLALHRGDTAAARAGADKLVGAAPAQPEYSRLAAAVSLETGELPKAAAQLRVALQAHPGDRSLRRLLGLTLVRHGEGRQALEVLQPLTGPGATDAEALALAAVASLQQGEPARAKALFAAASQHAAPGNAHLQATLALGRLTSGDAGAALRQLEELARADSGDGLDLALISARIQRQELEPALRAVEALERKQPRNPMVPLLRGDIQLRRGDRAAAQASFEGALQLSPHFFPAAAALADLDLREHRMDQARARFTTLLARDPGNAAAMMALARLDELAGTAPQESSRLLGDAVRSEPMQVAPRLRLIEHELRQGNWRAALTAADNAVQAMPSDLRLQGALARACMSAHEYNRAVQVLGKLAVAQPQSAGPLRQLARAQMALHRVDAARDALQQAARHGPEGAMALSDLARLEIASGRLDEARRIARQLQSTYPDKPLGYLLAGEAANAGRAWAEAEAAFGAAQARGHDNAQAAIGLHGALLGAGKAEPAERLATRWVREHPKDADFAQYLGDRALLARDYAGAVAHYQATLQRRPDSAAALNNLAWAAHQLGRPEALSYAERAVRLRPGEAAFVDTLARLLAAAGQWQPAIRNQVRAVELAPDLPAYRVALARLYLQAGEKAQARAELQRLDGTSIGPNERTQVADLRKLL